MRKNISFILTLLLLTGCGDTPSSSNQGTTLPKMTIPNVHEIAIPEVSDKIERANWDGVEALTDGFFITDDTTLLSFKMEDNRIGTAAIRSEVIFIDADNNPNSGYTSNNARNIGAEYLIEGNNVYSHAGGGWNWNLVSVVDRNIVGHELEVEFSMNLIDLSQNIRVMSGLVDNDWAIVGRSAIVSYNVTNNNQNNNSFTISDNAQSLHFQIDNSLIASTDTRSEAIFIDADNNPNSGYTNARWRSIGAEYLVQGNNIYSYGGAGWSWNLLSSIDMVRAGENITIDINKNILQLSNTIRVIAGLLDTNWQTSFMSTISTYNMQNMDNHANSRFSIIDTDTTITFNMQSQRIENDTLIRNSIFIDSDNNLETGYNSNRWQAQLGAEYLIENNTLYAYNGTGWNWTLVGNLTRNRANDILTIILNKDDLNNLSQRIRVTAYLVDSQWVVSDRFETISHSLEPDVFLIQGQSNAEARLGDSIATNANVISFGTTDRVPTTVRNDLNWYEAHANPYTSSHPAPGFIGKWGMQMGDRLVTDLNRDLIILNGAVGGTRIDQHQRDNNNPENLNTIYGRLLYRTNQANISDRARVLFWYQGENDGSTSAGTSIDAYKNRFRTLYNSWKSDYRNLEKIYMFQVRSGCGNPTLIMEAQRQIEEEYSDIEILSTSGTGTTTLTDNCHYTIEGYAELANRMQRLVKDDLYHIPQQDAHPPIVASARFANDRTAIDLRLREAQTLHIVGHPESDFRIENSNITVESIIIVNNRTIRLNLSAVAPANARLSYTGHTGNANNWVENSNNLGIISFLNRAIE